MWLVGDTIRNETRRDVSSECQFVEPSAVKRKVEGGVAFIVFFLLPQMIARYVAGCRGRIAPKARVGKVQVSMTRHDDTHAKANQKTMHIAMRKKGKSSRARRRPKTVG